MEGTLESSPRVVPNPLPSSEPLPLPHIHTTSEATSNSLEQAKHLLLHRRTHDPNYKHPQALTRLFSIKKRAPEPSFSYKEANRALLSIIDTNGDCGIASALFTLGANINVERHKSTSTWKKVARRNQIEIRSDLLAHAATVARPELVDLLAAHADQLSLDDAVGAAITRADLTILRTLLIERGASPLQWHAEFLNAVARGPKDIVALLLSGNKVPCPDCLSKSLSLTIDRTGCEDNLQLLVECGADADYNSGQALSAAARAQKLNSVAILIAAPSPPSVQSLDLAVSAAYEAMRPLGPVLEPAENHGCEIIARCLDAGAQGPNLDQVLVDVIRRNQSSLFHLLLQKPNAISVDHDSGAAIRLALEYQQVDVLDQLLAIGPSKTTLTSVVDIAMSIQSPRFRLESMSRILDRGACGVRVAEALVTAVEHISRAHESNVVGPETMLIQSLLAHADSNIDHNNGEALQLAIKNAPEHIVACILAKRPSALTLVAAFSAAIALPDKDKQLSRVTMLMASGAEGEAVDRSLIQAVDGGTANTELVQALLIQASVNYCEGQVFKHCVRMLDLSFLGLLLAKCPNRTSISTAAREAFSQSGTQRHLLFELLLSFLSSEDLGLALLHLSNETDPDFALIKKLLEAGAQVEYQGGACLLHAASTYNAQLLEVLGAFVKEKALFSQAFGSALHASRNWAAINNMPVFQYLLTHGARGTNVLDAISQVASKFDSRVLGMLADWIGVSNDLFSSAYDAVCTQSPAWLDIEHLDTIALLVAHGATGEAVAKSLSLAVTALAEGRTSENLVDVLLGGNVDVNYNHGAAIQLAAKHGLPHLLDKLMYAGGNSNSASGALITAIPAAHSETLLLQIVQTLMNHARALPDPNFYQTDKGSPLCLCLKFYPRSLALVTQFIDMGCDLQHTGIYCAVDIDERLDRDHQAGREEHLVGGSDADDMHRPPAETSDDARCSNSTGDDNLQEPVTVLMYALMQMDNAVSTEIINTLISRGANTAYAAPHSKTTALILASKYNRPGVVSELIKSGATVNTRDARGRSPLFHAASTGNDQAVAMILKKKPRTNDGSLHEASRELFPQIVQRLTAGNHDANFRSPIHGGRTALGELALHGRIPGLNSTEFSAAESTVDVLKENNADPLAKHRGKTIIFLALDNQNPLPIARVLIEQLLWSSINDSGNILQLGDYIYSPSMYVSQELMRGPLWQKRELLQLFDNLGCVNVFHAPFGKRQPEDAQGMPRDIEEYEKRRQERERVVAAEAEDHENQLRRELQRAQQDDFIEQSRYKRDFSNRTQEEDFRRNNIFLDKDLEFKIERAQMDTQVHIGKGHLELDWQAHQQELKVLQERREADLQHGDRSNQQWLMRQAYELKARDAGNAVDRLNIQELDRLGARKERAVARTDLYHRNEVRKIDQRRQRDERHEYYKAREDNLEFDERQTGRTRRPSQHLLKYR